MQAQFSQQSKSAAILQRVHWTKTVSLPGMIPHSEMLYPGGLVKKGYHHHGYGYTECLIVYDYTYVLDKIPELSELISASLVPGNPAYLEALREAFKEYQSNQKIETWSDVVKTLRGRLKMTAKELANQTGLDDSSIKKYERGTDKPNSPRTVVAVLAAIKNCGDEELLKKAKQIAVAEYQSKFDSYVS